jgi:hypothetical protein
MVHLKNIESPGLQWVQNDMTRKSQQRLPPAPVLLIEWYKKGPKF